MIDTEIDAWRNGVGEYITQRNQIIEDRVLLKQLFEEHIKKFFTYKHIEFSGDFDVITLHWEYNHDPVIRLDSIKGLGMDFIISHRFKGELGDGVCIELYPFGLPEEGEIIER